MIPVVGAVIIRDNTVLAALRGPTMSLPGLWEFPGGKIESGESHAEALVREISEELGCVIEVGGRITTTEHAYDFATIKLTTFYASLIAGTPAASEHTELKWLPLHQLCEVEWAPADLPTVDALIADHA